MAAKQDTRFGSLVVRNGFASPSEVELALDVQKQADPSENPQIPRIGEILVEMGTLDRQKVDALLVEQTILRKNGGSEAPAAEAPPGAPAAPPPPGAEAPAPAETAAAPGPFKVLLRQAGDKLKRLFRDVTGKRAKEKAAASERRDQLLVEIAQAALAAGASGSEADSARKAAEGLEAAKKQTGAAAKAAVKNAEAKHRRALLKLGRTLADKEGAPASEAAKAVEVKALDAKIKDLS
jgi:hypothetical protein